MPEKATTRLVSGEIMTCPGSGPRAPGAGADIVDAEYEIVAGQRFADTGNTSFSNAATAPVTGLGMLRGGATGPQTPRRWQRAGAAFWLGGIAIAAAAFWVSGGHALFGLANAGPGRPAGAPLRIVDLTSRVETSAVRSMLLVDGEAVNDGSTRLGLPPLSIEVTGADGSRTRYRLGTSGRFLQGGERFAFSGRFEVPKEGVKTVSVTFVE